MTLNGLFYLEDETKIVLNTTYGTESEMAYINRTNVPHKLSQCLIKITDASHTNYASHQVHTHSLSSARK